MNIGATRLSESQRHTSQTVSAYRRPALGQQLQLVSSSLFASLASAYSRTAAFECVQSRVSRSFCVCVCVFAQGAEYNRA